MGDFPTKTELVFITMILLIAVYFIVRHGNKKEGHDRFKL